MGKFRYSIRRARGGWGTWAVDKIHELGGSFYTKDNTRYFPTREKAEAYKAKKELEVVE